jgi:hypothetical protein
VIDGGLRGIFRKKLPHFHWQSIEVGTVGRGVPDSNYCHRGVEGWVEFKKTDGWIVSLRPEQVAWLLRRYRAGGRCWVAVRRQTKGGPRSGPPCDELWLIRGYAAAELKARGLKKVDHRAVAGVWHDGVAQWDWAEAERLLLS